MMTSLTSRSQSCSPLTTKKAGLGIGAFQSRAIVEAHGGRLSVESRMGEGTTFTVHLPTGGAPH